MDKKSKKRKKHLPPEGVKPVKRVRFSLVEETDKPVVHEPPTMKKAPESPGNDTSLSSLRKSIDVWMEQQAKYDESARKTLLEHSDNLEYREEEEDVTASLETPIRVALRGFTDEEKCKSIKFECEWRKCKYMSGTDRKYFLHVEAHGEATMAKQNGSYACEWDLCDFITENGDEFIGHVHYHAYHTKLKVHGASIHMLMKLPSCNNDSRARNTITNRPVTFRCEWDNCDERFNKAMHFFHHVRNHMTDLFQPGKKSSVIPVVCRWSLCKQTAKTMRNALQHLQAHTTEREIGCYTCGTIFWARLKYIDHCTRQIEMTQRKYQCPECDRYYATKALLRSHIERHDRPHECVLCPLKFSSAGILSQHMLQRHMKQRNFTCQQCEYGAYSRKDLMNHMRKHEDTKVFRCEEFGCNVAFKSEHAIKKHISWHYNLPATVFACHICSAARYTTSFRLSRHLLFAHKLERPPGHCRFRYKADSDGVFRLASFVEQQRQATKANEASGRDAVIPSTEPDGDGKHVDGVRGTKKKSKRKPRTEGNATKRTENAGAYAPIKGTPKVSSFASTGLHEFAITLDIEPEPNMESHPALQPKVVLTAVKDVKDFTVMKRYLKDDKT